MTHPRTLLLTIITVVLAATAAAPAQLPGMPGRSDAARDSGRLQASIKVYEGQFVAGETGTLGIILDIQRGWKIQAGRGSGDEVEPYIPTTIDLTLPEGWSAGSILWPEAKLFEMGDEHYSEKLMVYEGRIVAIARVTIPADVSPGEHTVKADIGYQACDDVLCEMPTSKSVEGRITVLPAGETPTPALDEATAALFVKVLALHPEPGAADSMASTDTEPTEADVRTAELPGADLPRAGSSFFGLHVPRADGLLGLFILALLSAIGGFVLNLTPCVLPVIPIKVMTILQHANAPGKNLVLGLWMAAGVVAFWVSIGLPVAFVAGVTDPSQLFGIWWVTFGIGLLIALMGFGIMGMFTIQLPQAIYAVNPRADTAWGSFAFGIMTAILGLPCFGFVAGALLAGAATLPASTIMIIFTSLGVGMALPYLVLSLKPSLVEKIPRTGPASELVKQVMGLLLLAAAAYFVGSGLIALISERPYLGRQLHWWAVAIFAAMAGLWLIVRTFQISPKIGPRLSFLFIGLLMCSIATAYALDSTSKARGDWEIRQAALAAAGGEGYVPGVWNQFTPEAFELARADGRIVVLDFTAEWCVNCKVLKATVLDRDPVRRELANDDVIKFTVDLTSTRAPGWQFLRELGQTGIPLLAIYTPGSDEPWQSNAYTPQQVLAAIKDARRERLAAR